MTGGIEDIFTNYGNTMLGINNDASLLLVALMFSIGISLLIGYKTRNKNVGLISFFMVMGIFAFIGTISWVYFIIPLILIGAFFMYRGHGGESE